MSEKQAGDDSLTQPTNAAALVDTQTDEDTEKITDGKNDVTVPISNKGEPEDINAALEHLPEHEREILKRQIEFNVKDVTWFTLFRYATTQDYIVMTVGGICAIACGVIMPLMTIIFGNLTGSFGKLSIGAVDSHEFMKEVEGMALKFVWLFLGLFVGSYVNNVSFVFTGERLTQKIREHYLASILRQNQAFFDKLGAGEITVKITSDTNQVQNAISEKVGMTIMSLAMFVAAFVVGFIKAWKFTFILTSTVVAMCVAMGIGSTLFLRYYAKSLASNGTGGTVAEEVLTSIRNAVAFGTEEKLALNYGTHLDIAEYWGRRTKIALGMTIGSMMSVNYLNFGLAFWQGGEFVLRGEADVAAVVTTLFAIMLGAFSLAGVAPNANFFQSGTVAAKSIFATIDRVSPLDPNSEEGIKLDSVTGTIELRNIKFIYPSRPSALVLPDMNLVIPAGKTTALVGSSGSGKSTVVGLVERFYDPVGGDVFLDGHNLKDLNLRWLRQQISLVQQEPVLFSCTIFENVCHGLIGTPNEHASEEVKRDLVVKACVMSNADGFINQLPEGYDTNVGQRGFLLSGGQKQRIAIARAVVSDPKILLLDEATSALDTRSEGIVQQALDRVSESRTTIVIAHRLSTIRNAEKIVVMSKGKIVEQGNHDTLMAQRGEYYALVQAQQITAREVNVDSTSSEGETETVIPEKGEQQKPIIQEDALRIVRTTTKQSVASIALKNKKKQDEKKYSAWTLFIMICKLNKPEKGVLLLGAFFAVIMGGGQPANGIFFAKAVFALSQPDRATLKHDVSFWALMFLMLGLVQLFANSISSTCLGVASEKLIRRVRDISFRTILRQEMAYFDEEVHSTGALTTFLSTEAIEIAGLSGVTASTILSAVVTLVASIAVSISLSWKIGLVCTACVPVLCSAGFLRLYLLRKYVREKQKTYEKSATYASEATAGIKTVSSLTRDADVYQHYHEQLETQTQKGLRANLRSAVLYALAESIVILIVALGFWYGAKLISEGEVGFEKFFIAFIIVLFGAQSAGQVFAFASDMAKAQQAATQVKALLDRQPEIDTWSNEGEPVDSVEGYIEFRDVHFRYPSRPHVPVLRGLNLTVKPGQYVALVGPSGCGKSTTIGLLERFYDSLSGAVLVDGKDITTLQIRDYRKHLALVSQEPTLYRGTIRENVLLGLGGLEDVPEEAIIQACKDANIHDFIISLPDGYNTDVGNKGEMLSGGQKQRVAIARALIRNPRILLLDEATSALDSESEKVVQDALDVAARGRTTIAVAHRLSTIQNADVIYVFEGGRVVESGTHQELLAVNGRYSELVRLQALEEG
ncbi:P-loop containing nucleoside triphosphate hydrolase protein [Wilcoxina mikolae CBS 423.85]|nr:P-loop containing nucleoside triphosphate hydrolase protein [Wilcoxina mikolae CBS 423.85]